MPPLFDVIDRALQYGLNTLPSMLNEDLEIGTSNNSHALFGRIENLDELIFHQSRIYIFAPVSSSFSKFFGHLNT